MWVQEQILWGWGAEKGIRQAYPQLSFHRLSDGNEALTSIPSKGRKEEPLQDSEGVTCSGHGLQSGGFGLCLLAKAQLAERHSFLE